MIEPPRECQRGSLSQPKALLLLLIMQEKNSEMPTSAAEFLAFSQTQQPDNSE